MKSKIILSILLTALLAGCGIKPREVDAPATAKGSYPATYPRPSADDIY